MDFEITTKQIKKISKFLSLILRHKPEVIGLELDENGWVAVETLLSKMNAGNRYFEITFEILSEVVTTNNKKRFAFNEDKSMIRASQGHSLEINLGYEAQKPPKILFHGTAKRFVDEILKTGLEKRNRQHVHLSSDIITATAVGQRHGKPVIFEVSAAAMYQDEFEFFLSENGVWLTESVPAKYLMLNKKP